VNEQNYAYIKITLFFVLTYLSFTNFLLDNVEV
jgi:hypothetical protein